MLKLVTSVSRESLNGGSTAAKREVLRCGLRRQVFSRTLRVLVSVAESLVGVYSQRRKSEPTIPSTCIFPHTDCWRIIVFFFPFIFCIFISAGRRSTIHLVTRTLTE